MTFASEVLARSAALYLKFDETTNGTATDSSGNAHHGTHTNVTLSQASMLGDGTGTSAAYNGTTAVTTVADGSWMDSTNITVVMRVKWGGVTDEFIATRWIAGGHRPFIFYISSAGKLTAGLNDDAVGSRTVGATTLVAGTTCTVAMRANGTTLQVFLNGVSDGSRSRTGPTQTAANFEVGRASGVANSPAKVDELAYFTTALSDADILALHNAAIAAAPGSYTGTATRALTITATSAGVRGRVGAAARSVTITAAAAGALGVKASAARNVALATTSTGVRGKVATALPSLAIAAVSAGVVVSGLVGSAAPTVTFSAAAAASLGRASQASQQLTFTTASAGVRGKLAAATTTLLIAASAAAALGIADTAARTLTVQTVAAGVVASGPVGHVSTTLSLTTVADGVVFSPPRTLIDWEGGRRRDGIGTATWDPPVVAVPPSTSLIKATAIDDVAIAGARARLTSRTLAIPRARHRVVVAGGDRTVIRGILTPEPTTGLVEPLLYGSGSIRWPQLHGAFERPGHGAWSWLTKYAPVKVQRVDDNGHVIDTDFRGFISDFGSNGRELTTSIMGEATGRGGRTWRPKPFVRDAQDIGHLAIMALRHGLRLPTMDKPPVTGIEVPDSGGQWQLDFLTSLTGRSTTLGGAQWTIMPDAHGRYRIFRKDVETIDFTVYVDDTRVVADLRRDFVEEHDREFVTAIGAHGMLIEFGRYPGLSSKGDPAPFPGHLELGDTGPDVFTLAWRLFQLGYLDDTNGDGKIPTPDVFTTKLAKAVRQLQDFAGLDETGEVDAATWRVAFKNDGQWSLRGSGIHPAAQKPFTRPFLHNASGQIIGRNPRSDRNRPFSDRAVNMGHVKDRSQARDWAQEDLSDDNAPNLVGTIDITMGAVIAGEHHPGDLLTADMLLDGRAIRPGMNTLVHYQGVEVLMHVASRDLQDSRTVQIAVDTRARDALEVWEIHELRHESHVNPERQWKRQNRSSVLDRDSMTGWSEIGGLIDSRVDWPGMTWTVFPVVAGEEGQIRDVDFQTVDDPAEFVLAFFGAKISPERLTHLVENPLTAAGRRAWRRHGDELRDNHLWLYEAGWDDNPLGYHPTTKPDAKLDFPEKGDDQVTGRWRDPAGFPYFCENGTVIWVAAFPRWDTHLDPGRLFKVQRDDSV